MKKIIVVAGGTGNLGERVINALLDKDVEIRVIARHNSSPEKVNKLEQLGVKVFKVDMTSVDEIAKVCVGASCVVSTLAGLREVIIDTQKVLLAAAVSARVPRFIPSDFSLDFTNLIDGKNRNLDLRREFHVHLDKAPISATTIFNGAFMDLLTGEMPMILFKRNRILYWGNADQHLDFTTIDNTAAFTAQVALDDDSPRYLKIAGDQITPRQMTTVLSQVTGQTFRLLKAGGLGLLNILIKIARTVAPGKDELYPAWQGMQYMRDMMEGRAKIEKYDNNRYPNMLWTSVKNMLAIHESKEK